MAFSKVNTILNTAPLIIQAATKLVRLLKDTETQGRDKNTYDTTLTMEEFSKELKRIQTRLDANNQSDIEQIKMIEELARQNEILAKSQSNSIKLLKLIAAIAVSALLVCLYLIFKSF